MANYNLIKELCERRGMTLGQLAEKLDMSTTGLFQILRNKTTKVKTLEDIARAFEIPVSVFFDDDPNDRIYYSSKEINDFLDKARAAQLGDFTENLFSYLIKEDDKYFITKTNVLTLMFDFVEDEKRWNRYGILIDKLLEERESKNQK